MTSSILMRNGRVISGNSSSNTLSDIWIENGMIKAVEPAGKIPQDRVETCVDASGLWILPGLLDMHVHLREPGLEYKETIETGTQAAVAGGFTSVACMANTHPVNDNPYVTSFILERARQSGACRVIPIGAVTKGLKGEELAEIGGMVDAGVRALSDDGMPVMNSYLMRKAMDYAKAFGVPVISHAEDLHLVGQGVMNEGLLSNQLGLRGNPAAAEEIMVAREIALCRLTRCPVHIAHLSTRLALTLVKRAKEEGLPITAEVSPHHLVLTEAAVCSYDTHCKMAPPLRSAEDVEALIDGLATGVIDVIATDHAPHGRVEKEVEFQDAANGILGLQTAIPLTLALVHQGRVSLERWVDSLTRAPARILNSDDGIIAVGKRADLTLLDPELKWTFSRSDIRSKSVNSPFIGHRLQGSIHSTWVDGIEKYRRSIGS